MASSSDIEKLRYVLTVLKNTELPQPNYHAVASDMGSTNANTAKFKTIIESAGFKLTKGQIVLVDEDTPPAPRTPRKSPAKKATTKAKTPAKKRRVEQIISNNNDSTSDEVLKEENEDEIKMLSARALRARSATVKAETATEETDEEAD
ncbi:hypothetical protein LTR24_000562 [Lithohypha guttulata]|uniref:H15 domain-containing protein n=1 Tax=Lithohypha guttulata TaxID=1690604 RepID=A0ABR0KN87_9EURO|nr:hypothetical protein LTR24_000562 [Lithohypha guttulata]